MRYSSAAIDAFPFNFHTCRFTGTVVGIEDADPKRWPESKWRCLKVFPLKFPFLNNFLDKLFCDIYFIILP